MHGPDDTVIKVAYTPLKTETYQNSMIFPCSRYSTSEHFRGFARDQVIRGLCNAMEDHLKEGNLIEQYIPETDSIKLTVRLIVAVSEVESNGILQ